MAAVNLTTPTAVEEVMAADAGPAVIDFWASWCGPCMAMAPHFEAVAEAYADSPVRFYKIDTEKHPRLAEAFHVRSLPTTLFVDKGEIKDAAVGALSERRLTKKVEWLLGKSQGQGLLSRLFGGKKDAPEAS